MPRTCYVVFDPDPKKLYAYHCGNLTPKEDQMVVILVGKDSRRKLVQCVKVTDEIDPLATSTIFGIVQEQPNASSL